MKTSLALIQMTALLAVTPFGLRAQAPAQLLAHYTLDGTPNDATGNSPPMVLQNTSFVNDSLYLNGIYGGPDSFHAAATINGLSYPSFTVALDFLAEDFDGFLRDNILTGGLSYRWFSLRHNAGRLEVTLNNQNLVYLLPDSRLKTNQWQTVICSVDALSKRILTGLNGQRLGDVMLAADFRYDVIGTDAEETDRLFAFANWSNGSAFHGYVDNLKVWNRALTSAELNAMLQNVPSYALPWFTIDGGGGTTAGGRYVVSGTIAQPDAGALMIGGAYAVAGGFWGGVTGGAIGPVPRLSIRVAGTAVVLSWPNPSTGYVLQQTATMTGLGGIQWSDVSQTPVMNGSNKEVTITVTGTSCMFRLHTP